MESRMTKRLQKDLETIQKNYKESFIVELPNNDLKIWFIYFTGPKTTVYEGEQFKFPSH